MSSMYLLKEHNGKSPGDVVSVPFGEGQRLIGIGVAIPWNDGRDLPAIEPPGCIVGDDVQGLDIDLVSIKTTEAEPPAEGKGRKRGRAADKPKNSDPK